MTNQSFDTTNGSNIDSLALEAFTAGSSSEFNPEQATLSIKQEITAVVAETLAGLHLPSEQVLKILHTIAADGIRIWDDPSQRNPDGTQRLVRPGEWRKEYVYFGPIACPRSEDVPNLVKLFCEKLDLLLSQAGTPVAELLALWAYTVMVTIHPFDDVNGRVGRGLIDYVMQYVQKPKGLEVPLNHLAYSDDAVQMGVFDQIIAAQLALDLAPTQKAKDKETGKGVVIKTPKDLFFEALNKKRPDKYFDAINAQIIAHLDSIHTVEDIMGLEPLKDFSRLLAIAKLATKYRTKSLAATEAGVALRKDLGAV